MNKKLISADSVVSNLHSAFVDICMHLKTTAIDKIALDSIFWKICKSNSSMIVDTYKTFELKHINTVILQGETCINNVVDNMNNDERYFLSERIKSLESSIQKS